MLLLQFGAGNIGRSFIGQLFARAGYEVCFVDVDESLVAELNARRAYTVEIRDTPPDEIEIAGVRAVGGRDLAQVAEEVAKADVIGVAVGPAALRHLFVPLAKGLQLRAERGNGPVDVILCENLRDASGYVREGLKGVLPEGFPLEERVGLVETSIGKMVPLVPERERRRDPLRVFAEAYNTLICDARGFLCGVPQVPGLEPKDNIRAYVDRKLFIHNLGHAVSAYVGFLQCPEAVTIWEVLEDQYVLSTARCAMWEAGRALIAEYPEEFDEASIDAHIEDLLRRFANRKLGDTIYRVGRDLNRKLSGQDRLVGALRLAYKHNMTCPTVCLAIACALRFRATDEQGEALPADTRFLERVDTEGALTTLAEVADLDPRDPARASLLWQCMDAVAWLNRSLRDDRRPLPHYYELKGA